MLKLWVALFWILGTSVLIRYTMILGFDHDTGIIGSILFATTVLWFYAFFKNPTQGK